MRQDYTDITIVLDRSGSMQNVKKETIEGFNKFLKDQQDLCGEVNETSIEAGEAQTIGDATLTLIQFSNTDSITYDAQNILTIRPLTDQTYCPNGGTALLDAMGDAINNTGKRLSKMKEADRPARVIFVIITDGGENASTKFTCNQIFNMVNHQSVNYKWSFVFLGANQDAIQAGSSLGISAGASMSYASNSIGTKQAFMSVSKSIGNYRGLAPDMAFACTAQNFFSDEDRKFQYTAGAVADMATSSLNADIK